MYLIRNRILRAQTKQIMVVADNRRILEFYQKLRAIYIFYIYPIACSQLVAGIRRIQLVGLALVRWLFEYKSFCSSNLIFVYKHHTGFD